mmetsp:Transcript_65302/g.204630  ORF Transcript_65302/g.204630 Transcript_65302/m.204630 type:complete len:714 (+) Transcript_65302:66-2207(+)
MTSAMAAEPRSFVPKGQRTAVKMLGVRPKAAVGDTNKDGPCQVSQGSLNELELSDVPSGDLWQDGLPRGMHTSPTPNLSLSDMMLIVVGAGVEADELCRRRLAAGGHLCALRTDRPPGGAIASSEHFFIPPTETTSLVEATGVQRFTLARARAEKGRCSFPKSMNLGTVGPDVQVLKPEQDYLVVSDGDGVHVGVCVLEDGGKAVWALSGKVVFAGRGFAHLNGACDTIDKAREEDVSVAAEEAKPYPELRVRWVAIWTVLYLLVLVPFLVLMARHEPHLTESGVAYWRALLSLTCSPLAIGALEEGLSFAFGGVKLRPAAEATACVFTTLLTAVCHIYPLRWDGATHTLTYFVTGLVIVNLPGSMILLAQLFAKSCQRSRAPWPAGVAWAWKRQALWAVWVNMGFSGSWAGFYGLAVAFNFAAPAYPELANLLLPLLNGVMESVIITATDKMYELTVNKARYEGRLIKGDQKMVFLFPIASTHAYAQAQKLCSLLINGVKDPEGLNWITSVAVGFVMTLMSRTDIMRGPASKVLPHWIVKRLVVGDAKVLHSRLRTAVSYPVFIVPVAIVISRSIRGEEKVLYSDMALVILTTAFCVAVLEDVIIMRKWLPVNSWVLALEPFYKERRPGSTGQVLHFDCRGRATTCARDLRNLRALGFLTTGGWMVGMLFFPLCLLQLLLGVGFVYGVCDTPLGNSRSLKYAFFWTLPISCQ